MITSILTTTSTGIAFFASHRKARILGSRKSGGRGGSLTAVDHLGHTGRLLFAEDSFAGRAVKRAYLKIKGLQKRVA